MIAAVLSMPARLRHRVHERRELAAIHAEMARVLGAAARDEDNLERRPCPACGADAPEDRARIHAPVYRFHRCRACGLLYVPRVLRADLVRERYAATPVARAYRALLRAESSPEAYRGLVERLAGLTPAHALAIDVGCGFGALTAALGARFADVVGLELDEEIAAAARHDHAIDVSSERLEELARARVDLITMNQILEHVADARVLVEAAHRLLAPRGVLWISVPQGGSLGVALRGGRHPVVATHMHLNLFTADTLRALVTRAGFEVESLSSDDDPALGLGLVGDKLVRLAARRTGLVARRRRGACLDLVARRI